MSSRIRVQLIHFEYANHAHTSSSTFSMKFSPCHVLEYLNAKGQGPVPEIIYLFAHFSTPWQLRAIRISLNLMRLNGLPLFQDSPQIDNRKHFLVFPSKLSLKFSLSLIDATALNAEQMKILIFHYCSLSSVNES